MFIYVLHYRFQHRHLDSPRVLFFFCIDDCIFTARNKVGARLCFHRCVWFCSQGGSTWPGTHPWDQVHPPRPGTPWDQVPPRTRYTPLDQVHHPGPGTPPNQVHPPGPGIHTPPGTRYTPWDQVQPPRTRYTPLPRPGTAPPGYTPSLVQSMLGDTVNARAVRILLECNLVHMNSTFVTCSFLGDIGINSIQHFICCYCLDHCPVIDHLHWATPWSEWYHTVRPFPCYSSLTLIDSDTKYNGFNSNAWGMVTFTNFCTDPCLKALPNVVYISVFQFCWQEYRRLTCGHLI